MTKCLGNGLHGGQTGLIVGLKPFAETIVAQCAACVAVSATAAAAKIPIRAAFAGLRKRK